MGYFDKLADSTFKEGPKGEVIFYANGALSKGRVVPDEETRVKLHKFQKRTLKLSLFIGLPYCWLVGVSSVFSIASLSPIILFWLYIFYKQYSLTRNFEKHDLKLKFGEAAKKGANALPNWYSWISGVISVLLIIMGLLLPYLSDKPFSDFTYLVLGFVSFGLLGLGFSIRLYRLNNLTRPSN